eukprot:6823465-Ditylum_brightwellii.AAC.1
MDEDGFITAHEDETTDKDNTYIEDNNDNHNSFHSTSDTEYLPIPSFNSFDVSKSAAHTYEDFFTIRPDLHALGEIHLLQYHNSTYILMAVPMHLSSPIRVISPSSIQQIKKWNKSLVQRQQHMAWVLSLSRSPTQISPSYYAGLLTICLTTFNVLSVKVPSRNTIIFKQSELRHSNGYI